jgi:hypothetical protein
MPVRRPDPAPVTSTPELGFLERLALRAAILLTAAVVLSLLFQACASRPPSNIDDVCAIFEEKESWRAATRRSFERWGIPASVQLAIVHQESRFRAGARPDWRWVAWVVPAGRLSSAYGYGQVKDGTWADYVRATGNRGADREDFADVADFIGWYGDVIHRGTGVAKDDAYHLYLAYHEGPGGFARGSHQQKPWLLGVARKVEDRARLYRAQYSSCREVRAKPR